MSAILDLVDSFFLQQKEKMVETGPFSSLQRPSPSSSFEINGKICQGNLTRIGRTIQKCCARRTGLVVSYDAWVKMTVLALSAQRAQFTFSTQGIVTHSQARGGEAGAQPNLSCQRR